MRPVERIQAYIRESTRSTHVSIAAPPFTVFLNFAMLLKPDDPKAIFAIPDTAVPEAWSFTEMLDAFQRQKGNPRVQTLDTFAPDLLCALADHGFKEDKRQTMLYVTPDKLVMPPEPEGFSLLVCSSESPLEEIIAGCTINVLGFDEDVDVTEEFAEDFRSTLQTARAFMGGKHGEGVSAGMYTEVMDGVTELVGITTLPDYRRQGFAAALTAKMAQTAFDNGMDLVFLVAASPEASRVYQRVGFEICGALVEFGQRTPQK